MAGGKAKRKTKLVGCRERAWKGKESYTKGQEPMKRGQLERQQPRGRPVHCAGTQLASDL